MAIGALLLLHLAPSLKDLAPTLKAMSHYGLATAAVAGAVTVSSIVRSWLRYRPAAKGKSHRNRRRAIEQSPDAEDKV